MPWYIVPMRAKITFPPYTFLNSKEVTLTVADSIESAIDRRCDGSGAIERTASAQRETQKMFGQLVELLVLKRVIGKDELGELLGSDASTLRITKEDQ